MNLNFSSGGGDLGFLVVIAMVCNFFVTIFWMVVAWRAMRAHEGIANAQDNLVRAVRALAEKQEQKK